jgi:RNA polymerase sigma factor (sigma-70 family)
VDDAKFEAAWEAHGSAVLRYCTYSTGSSDAGQDVAAETFARFLAKGERVADELVEAWLIRVARNLCANHHRDAKRRGLLEQRLADDHVAIGGWVRPDSWEYVRRLKESERLVVYLRVAEDRSFADVARLLGKSESAAKMTFYRAIERLRRDMQRDGVGATASLQGGADYV